MHYSYSSASPDDISAMAFLEASWNYRSLPPTALSDTGALFIPLGAEGLTKILADRQSYVLICKDSTRLCGMVVACSAKLALEMWPSLSANYAPADSVWEEPFLYVKTIAIDPELIGRGIGKGLLLELKKLATGTENRAVLAVIALAPKNNRSVALFTGALGSKEIGRYHDREKGILWGLFKSCLSD